MFAPQTNSPDQHNLLDFVRDAWYVLCSNVCDNYSRPPTVSLLGCSSFYAHQLRPSVVSDYNWWLSALLGKPTASLISHGFSHELAPPCQWSSFIKLHFPWTAHVSSLPHKHGSGSFVFGILIGTMGLQKLWENIHLYKSPDDIVPKS
jgi:hypothetical protein